MTRLIIVFLLVNFLSSPALSGVRAWNIVIEKNIILVTTPKGRVQRIVLNREVQRNDIKFEDLNFDGVADIKLLRDRGANQEFYDVYLYTKQADSYQFSKEFSDLPCVEADGPRKEVIAACFHESACENWEERYSVDSKGRLSLVERTGTYCVPSGETYAYTDFFKNGKKTSSQEKKIKDKSD